MEGGERRFDPAYGGRPAGRHRVGFGGLKGGAQQCGEQGDGRIEAIFWAGELRCFGGGGGKWVDEEGRAESLVEAAEALDEVRFVSDGDLVGFGGFVFLRWFVGYDVDELLREETETASFGLRFS